MGSGGVVIPFVITLILLLTLVPWTSDFLMRRTRDGHRAFWYVLGASVILFVPSCALITFAVDAFRYGKFHYSSASQISDSDDLIPPSARAITIYRSSSGCQAKYTVREKSLINWLERQARKRLGDDSKLIRPSSGAGNGEQPDTSAAFTERFGSYGWKYEGWMKHYQIPGSVRSGPLSVWHNPETEEAYEDAVY
ncbi:MAG: hypothetical protein R3E01_17390 [Pirellulaceae bacterium]|nr:hypothetical protein [Planctomycetales bacterium]